MPLKDAARDVAVLDALYATIGDRLKEAKKTLDAELKTAKAESGTKKITVSLDDEQEIGSASLVEPKPAASVSDSDQFLAWVRAHYASEVTRRFVTAVTPAFTKKVLDHISATGTLTWTDRDTGEIHEVPGVQLRERTKYVRLTVPDEGRDAIATAWREGRINTAELFAIGPGGDE